MHLELFERGVTKGELTLVDPSGARHRFVTPRPCREFSRTPRYSSGRPTSTKVGTSPTAAWPIC